MINVASVFRETMGKQPIIEVMLVPEVDVGDKENRKARMRAPLLSAHPRWSHWA